MSARFRSAARRLFFNGDAMASKKSGQRAAAAWDSPLVKRRNDFIQREVRFLADEGEICRECFSNGEVLPPLGMGSEVPFSRKRCTHRIAELTLTSNCSAASRRDPPSSTKFDDARSQLTRIRSMHWPALRRINALRLAPPACLGESQFTAVGTCCNSDKSAARAELTSTGSAPNAALIRPHHPDSRRQSRQQWPVPPPSDRAPSQWAAQPPDDRPRRKRQRRGS